MAASADDGDAGLADAAAQDRARRLDRWNRRATPAIVAAAVLPLAGALVDPSRVLVAAVVLIVCWIVFVVDFAVHLRLDPGYLHRTWGRIDLAIVVLTFPWNLLPFANTGAGRLLLLARLARVVRVMVVAAKGAPVLRRMAARLGRAALYAAIAVVASAWIVYVIEEPTDGFESFGDALWWAIVTVTTVGYGDIVPDNGFARFVASMLMIAGIALIGALAGTLASALGLQPTDAATAATAAVDADTSEQSLHAEIAALRREVASLTDLVQTAVGTSTTGADDAPPALDERPAAAEGPDGG